MINKVHLIRFLTYFNPRNELFGKERTSEVKKESADAIHFHINENI
jgi:hypothetical protein